MTDRELQELRNAVQRLETEGGYPWVRTCQDLRAAGSLGRALEELWWRRDGRGHGHGRVGLRGEHPRYGELVTRGADLAEAAEEAEHELYWLVEDARRPWEGWAWTCG